MRQIWFRPRFAAICSETPFEKTDYADAVEVQKPDIAERRRNFAGIVELGRVAEGHGVAGVDEEVDRQIRFFIEDPQNELVEPEVSFPIDIFGVVAADVRPVIRELDARALLSGPVLAAQVSWNHAVGDEFEVFELPQKLLVKKRADFTHFGTARIIATRTLKEEPMPDRNLVPEPANPAVISGFEH